MILVDFHAEATSEKITLGWHLDSRVSALIGTHTHADRRRTDPPGERPALTDADSPGGTTGLGTGMASGRGTISTSHPAEIRSVDSRILLNGCVLDLDETTGRAPRDSSDLRGRFRRRMKEPATGSPSGRDRHWRLRGGWLGVW